MPSPNRKMALAVLPSSAPFSWRNGLCRAEADLDFELYRHLAQTAERGKFDLFFIRDSYCLREDRFGLAGMAGYGNVVLFEALTLASALVGVTKHLGLVATASTTYNEPYHLARKFASLDHLSRGRAGWNVITSYQDGEALNFGLDAQLGNATRYERAEEFLEVVLGLWDSWEDEAILRDLAAQRYFDPARVHRLAHEGKHFRVQGPLNLSRPPQGHPVLCQAGASETGWDFAARHADVQFAKAITLDEAQRFYAQMKARVVKHGRAPEALKILPGLVPVVGRTEKEAWEKYRAVQDCLTEEEGKHMLTHMMPGTDFAPLGLDEPMPHSPGVDLAVKKFRLFLEKDGRRLTLREVIDGIATGYGHLRLIGTPGQVADTLVQWVNERGADGFNLLPQHLPGSLEEFVDRVVPELQERGAFRTEYEGGTLRENLGLERPGRVGTP